MKKLVSGILIGATAMFSFQVFAEGGLQKIEAYLNPNLAITFNGTPLTIKDSPITYEGTTFLPLREIGNQFGINVNWNESTGTVELSTKTGGELGHVSKSTKPRTEIPAPNPPTSPPEKKEIPINRNLPPIFEVNENSIETTIFEELQAIKFNNEIYFNFFQGVDKYFDKFNNNIQPASLSNVVIFHIRDKVDTQISTNDTKNFVSYNNEAYLNSKYFPLISQKKLEHTGSAPKPDIPAKNPEDAEPQFEIIENYINIDGLISQALIFEGKTFVWLDAGAKKYNLGYYDWTENSVKFRDVDLEIPYSVDDMLSGFNANMLLENDTFFYGGRPFVKEKILIEASQEETE